MSIELGGKRYVLVPELLYMAWKRHDIVMLPRVDNTRKHWTERDDTVVREHYRTKGARACAQLLGRTELSVVKRASILGCNGSQRTEADDSRR